LAHLARFDPSRTLWRRIPIIGVLPLILRSLPNRSDFSKRAAKAKQPDPIISKKQSSLVIAADESQDPLVVGSITNYQIVNPPRGKVNPRKKVENVSPDRKKRIIVVPKPTPRDPPRVRIELDEEQLEVSPDVLVVEPEEATEEMPQPSDRHRMLKIRKRYWHVLGIDIIVNSNLEPVVLELNDRPSLMVTVPFEHDLKVKLLRDCFFHVDANGESHGDCEESDWQQIFPLPETASNAAMWAGLLAQASIPVGPGNALASSSATNRMVSSGVRQSLHEENRQRFFERKEVSKVSRFVPYSNGA
jgi:hypothetical protein